MRRLAALLAFLVWAAPAKGDGETPLRAMIVSMAQRFVQEPFMAAGLGRHHIEFDLAYLHRQPEANYWAVVGGFVSDQSILNS